MLSSRIAICAFQSWDKALAALAEVKQAGTGQPNIVTLALSSVLLSSPRERSVGEHFVELQIRDLSEPVFCSSGPAATKMAAKSDGGGVTLAEMLECCLLQRLGERIESYVKDGKIVMGVFLSRPGDERRVGLTMLAHSATPVEMHDLRGSKSRASA